MFYSFICNSSLKILIFDVIQYLKGEFPKFLSAFWNFDWAIVRSVKTPPCEDWWPMARKKVSATPWFPHSPDIARAPTRQGRGVCCQARVNVLLSIIFPPPMAQKEAFSLERSLGHSLVSSWAHSPYMARVNVLDFIFPPSWRRKKVRLSTLFIIVQEY